MDCSVQGSTGFRLIGGRYVIDKDPEDNLPYGIRLQRWLDPGDSLINVQPVWTCSPDLVIVSQGKFNDPTYGWTAGVKLRAGIAGQEEWAHCVWTTDLGLIKARTLYFNMVDN